MSEKYLVPDFYTDFSCKCGACRKPCCSGWDVTLTMKEYFSLMGLDCSASLRSRLDKALLLEKNGSEDRYGLLNKNFFGDCPLHDENGYCALQCECGEESLSSVCRIYPRSPKKGTQNECTLSNSCEGVVEQLWQKHTPITFVEVPLSFVGVKKSETQTDITARKQCMQILNGEGNVRNNLSLLVAKFLSDKEGSCDILSLMNTLQNEFATFSPDIKELSDTSFGGSSYDGERQKLFSRFDGLENLLKHLMVNNAFYKQLPACEENRSVEDDVTAFALSYLFLEYLLVGNAYRLNTKELIVDAIADIFRFINHTRFEHNVLVLSKAQTGIKNGILTVLA